MAKTEKTNASRLLDRAGIKYELIAYPVDEEHLDARHVADAVGEDINKVFKTIVLHGERTGHFVCVLPGNAEIDLKLAAKAAGDKKAELIAVRELLPLTGYIRGGCSPIGMKKSFPTFFDSDITGQDEIYVSAGRRGLQLKINAADLVAFVHGNIADIKSRT